MCFSSKKRVSTFPVVRLLLWRIVILPTSRIEAERNASSVSFHSILRPPLCLPLPHSYSSIRSPSPRPCPRPVLHTSGLAWRTVDSASWTRNPGRNAYVLFLIRYTRYSIQSTTISERASSGPRPLLLSSLVNAYSDYFDRWQEGPSFYHEHGNQRPVIAKVSIWFDLNAIPACVFTNRLPKLPAFTLASGSR